MQITTYLRPHEPITLSDYTLCVRIGGFRSTRKMTHSTLTAVSKRPMPHAQLYRTDGRDERILALRNGEAVRAYIEKYAKNGKDTLFIHKSLDIVERIDILSNLKIGDSFCCL